MLKHYWPDKRKRRYSHVSSMNKSQLLNALGR